MNQDCGRVELFFGIKGNPAVGTDIIDIRHPNIFAYCFMHTLRVPSSNTYFGDLFMLNVFPGGKSEWHLRQIQERKKRETKKRQHESPILFGLLGLVFPTPSRSTTWHGWTGLAGLIILVHRYSNRTPTIGAHSELA